MPESSTAGSKCVRSGRSLFTRKFVVSAISCNCGSRAFRDYLRSLVSRATGDYTRQGLSSFSALSVRPLGLRSGMSKANGTIKIAHEYIDVVYLLSLL